jgi:hypothetical protein
MALLIDIVVAHVKKDDAALAKFEEDPIAVIDAKTPELFQLPVKFMRVETGIKRILAKPGLLRLGAKLE